ncbi:MAG TPA: DUF2306 domain-containing protein [Candidatus Acidoferrum sp.]|nr:DUF2306 domain-containing protein [Candidatus Acidoferrum sp.]
MSANRGLVRLLWAAVIFLALIGVGVATRRAIVLYHPQAAPRNARFAPAAALDEHFASERGLILAHVIPGILFMILGPLQFVKKLRAKYPRLHRWSGRIFLCASGIIGVTGLTMAWGKTIGGMDETAAITLFGVFFLFALAKAFWHAIHREFARHREWMIRGYAIGLAVATIRPIIGAFFAVSVARGHVPDPHEFFGTAFWIGFTLQMMAAEAWINYTRPTAAARGELLTRGAV